MKICLDPGHGDHDPGAVNARTGHREKDVVLAIGLLLRDRLEGDGHEVVMTRDDDTFVPLIDRAELANGRGCALFLSIHANSHVNSAEGIETFHFPGSSTGAVFAGAVQSEMMREFADHRNRGVKTAEFAVLRYTRMTAALAETEFISNDAHARFLADPAVQARYAGALARAVARYDAFRR
jgi:N-acetylmuramoyl-L-alanine amidase